jgi:hypothetical protein
MYIDFIWISRSLVLESINSNSFTSKFFNTDHNTLYLNSYILIFLGVTLKLIYTYIRLKNASMIMTL